MNFVLINKSDWQKLNQRLETMEGLLHTLIKQQNEIIVPKEKDFISRKEAAHKFQCSLKTIDKKTSKHNISRLEVGKHKLLKESELIEAFKTKGPKPLFLVQEPSMP